MPARYQAQRRSVYHEAQSARVPGAVKQVQAPMVPGPTTSHIEATRQVCEALGVGPLAAMEFLATLGCVHITRRPRTLHAA